MQQVRNAILLFLALYFFQFLPLNAQELDGTGKKGERVEGLQVVPFPLVIVNPTMGSGGGLT